MLFFFIHLRIPKLLPMERNKYDVFISYSRKDYKDEEGNVIPGNVVSKIKDALDEAGISFWFDENGIHHGDDFGEKIVVNIEDSEIFIFLSTLNSNSSKWTRKEISVAHELDKTIIPVRIDNSKYDRAVMFKISDLDYLDYEKNPEEGVKNLVKTVKHYLEEKQKQERIKKEKEEEEELRKRELLEREIQEVESKIKELELKELEVEVFRKSVLLRIEKISDETQRKRLVEIVNENVFLNKAEIEAKNKIIIELKSTADELKEEIMKLHKEASSKIEDIKTKDQTILGLKEKVDKAEQEIVLLKSKLEKERQRKESETKAEQERLEREKNKKSNTINGHEYVDLGLPSGLKWATCNVGANKPEEYGDYFAWGETEAKQEYIIENYKNVRVIRKKGFLGIGEKEELEYIIGFDISGNPQYDVARKNWGGSWRMPTKAELEELKKNCRWEWTIQNGVNGCKVTGPNGNSIFLPAAGFRYGTSLRSDGYRGGYWSSTPYDYNYDGSAYYLYFRDGSEYVSYYYRRFGQTVRPITE